MNDYKCGKCGKFMDHVSGSGLKYCKGCQYGQYNPDTKKV